MTDPAAEAEKRYPYKIIAGSTHLDPMQYIKDNQRAAFIAGAEWEREQVVIECRDELLKQLHNMVHVNGYPTEGVAKSTILSLPALMKLGYKNSQLGISPDDNIKTK